MQNVVWNVGKINQCIDVFQVIPIHRLALSEYKKQRWFQKFTYYLLSFDVTILLNISLYVSFSINHVRKRNTHTDDIVFPKRDQRE